MESEHTIGLVKAIRYHSYQSGPGVETVYLIRQAGSWSEILQKPIGDVCKVHFLVSGVNSDIIKRAELTSKVVVEDD